MIYADFDGPSLNFGIPRNAEENIRGKGAFKDPNHNSSGQSFGLTIVELEAGGMSIKCDERHYGFDVDILHLNANVGLSSDIIGVDAIAEMTGASGNVKIPFFGRVMTLLLLEM